MTPARQRDLFGLALQQLATLQDLVNHALEVVEDVNGEVTIELYRIPVE